MTLAIYEAVVTLQKVQLTILSFVGVKSSDSKNSQFASQPLYSDSS